jgi:hypothetical protein
MVRAQADLHGVQGQGQLLGHENAEGADDLAPLGLGVLQFLDAQPVHFGQDEVQVFHPFESPLLAHVDVAVKFSEHAQKAVMGRDVQIQIFPHFPISFLRHHYLQSIIFPYVLETRGGCKSSYLIYKIKFDRDGLFRGIALVALIHARLVDQTDQALIIGFFGVTPIRVDGAKRSPLAQPRNVLGGCSFRLIGVCVQQTLGATPWLAAAVAVMQITTSATRIT